MSDQSGIAKFALNDILLGIAQGLKDAQQQLKSQAPYDEYGRANTIYHVPYLDFQLQVSTEYEEISTGAPTSQQTMPVRFGPVPKGSFKYSATAASSTTTSVGMSSTISGRFVATVPNDGVPQLLLQVHTATPVSASTEYRIDLDVQLANVLGEKMPGSTIEFNFDEPATLALNTRSYAPPRFSITELNTDANGLARTQFFVKKTDYDAQVRYIVHVNAGTLQKAVSICKL